MKSYKLKLSHESNTAYSKSLYFWAGLILVSGIPRIPGAFLLPNAFGDAYAYIEAIEIMSGKMSEGTFSIKDLFGFWLPLYQFICALINVFINSPFYVAKLFSAVCGIGVCLLVFSISLQLTGHQILSLLSFALISLNPAHILYSASALTDVPQAFFILCSLYFVIKKRWMLAAIFVAVASLIRVESWIFIALLPLLQLLDRGKVSPGMSVVLVLSPLLWLYICWEATGNPLAYFETRSLYVKELIAANPRLASFSLTRVVGDARTLLNSTNPAVMIGGLIGFCLIVERITRSNYMHVSRHLFVIVTAGVYFFGSLGSLFLAYITGNQPDMWHRYGLILFALGIPVLSWTFLEITQRKPHWARKLSILVVVICVWQASFQLADAIGFINQVSAQRIVADYLKDKYNADPNIRIFCDDGTVRALSDIPPEQFLASSNLPDESELFLTRLKENGVEYLVYMKIEGSTPVRLFPELSNGTGNNVFRPVMHTSSKYWRTDIWLYQLTDLR